MFDFIKIGKSQVESLTHKVELQDIELERISKQLKEAIALAGEESSKCKAAKEVIKSLTGQVRSLFKIIMFCCCIVPVSKSNSVLLLHNADTEPVSYSKQAYTKY